MNYIGIDLGGTNIKGALVSAGGEILNLGSIRTLSANGLSIIVCF